MAIAGHLSQPAGKFILKPAYVLSVLLAVVAINVFLLVKKENTVATADNSLAQQNLASEYHLNETNSLYDLNSDK